MARLRNPRKLVWWAMVESLSLMARGIPKAAIATSVMNRQALPYPTVATKLNDFAPTVKSLNKRLLQNEPTLDTAFITIRNSIAVNTSEMVRLRIVCMRLTDWQSVHFPSFQL